MTRQTYPDDYFTNRKPKEQPTDHQYFETREDARRYANSVGKIPKDAGKGSPKERRWYV